jgi:hypothetical protein
MKKIVIALLASAMALMATSGVLEAAEKSTIKMVMKKAMKGKTALTAKVASGDATADEKTELVALFTKLAAAKPKKGDAASWTAKTTALLAAAKGVAAGDADAVASLAKAKNCKACHSVHK